MTSRCFALLSPRTSAGSGRYPDACRVGPARILAWCAERRVDPLAASRPQVELYVRWMQEIRRLKPSTTSRRMSIVAGFYRTAVIDGLLEHSPAEHVRRPHVPAESPTLGLTHLQLEALLDRRPAVAEPVRLRAGLPARAARAADLRSHRLGHCRPRRGTRPPRPAGPRQGRQDGPCPAAAGGRTSPRPGDRRPDSSERFC